MKVIYPGTFDPLTKGHLDIIDRSVNIFGDLTVAVSKDSEKNIYFSLEERVKMIGETLGIRSRVHIKSYSGLLSNYVRKTGFNIIVRGLRNSSDLSFELRLFNINKKLYKNTETVFMAPSEENIFISSTSVREIIKKGGDIGNLVPKQVKSIIEKGRGLCL